MIQRQADDQRAELERQANVRADEERVLVEELDADARSGLDVGIGPRELGTAAADANVTRASEGRSRDTVLLAAESTGALPVAIIAGIA